MLHGNVYLRRALPDETPFFEARRIEQLAGTTGCRSVAVILSNILPVERCLARDMTPRTPLHSSNTLRACLRRSVLDGRHPFYFYRHKKPSRTKGELPEAASNGFWTRK